MSIIYPQQFRGNFMDKIYGYKENDIIGLAEFLMKNKVGSLSRLFEQFATQSGKAKGTVRNLYYALAKVSNSDAEFCQKYLGGKAIEIAKSKEFKDSEEKELITEILRAKTNGRSVRSIIMQMAGGDAKVALRYQNKYRNVIKNKPQLALEIAKEVNGDYTNLDFCLEKRRKSPLISNEQFDKLKGEIDCLVQKISSKIKKENEYLKQRVGILESQNQKLIALLYGGDNAIDAKRFFKSIAKKEFIN